LALFKSKDINQDETLSIVKRVLSENWRLYRMNYVFAFLLLFAVAASTAYPAYVIRDVVNEVFDKKNLDVAFLLAFAVFASFVVRGFATYGYMYVLGKISNNIVARYQRRVFNHLLKLGIGFHKSNRSAYLVGQINQNIIGMRSLLNDVLTVFARDLLTLIALIAVMAFQDPFMSLFSLAVLPILALVIAGYVRRVRKVARQEVDLNAKVTSAIVENSQGMEIVKAFTMEELMMQKMRNLTQEAESRSNRIIHLNAKTKPVTEILAGSAIAAAIAFGGFRVVELGHDPGSQVSFLAAAMLAYDPARKLASFRVQFERSAVNARMLYEILDLPQRQADKADAKELQVQSGRIEFTDVQFSYHDDEKVLNGVNIIAEPGKTTALVGPSGGGKSTLVSLAQRFFDVDDGSVRIDGQNIADVTAHSLRNSIAYVSQQPMMFEGTIRENIQFGRPEASEEQIVEAAKLAQAHEFILEQPQGYDTPVGELGGNLSGGQRQRLSIARAFLRDAPILLLDEATSALDNESELLVQEALDKLVKGRTTIVVAHRLSTIRNANRIYVIENGKVTQEGTHVNLLKRKTGTYARLHGIAAEPLPKQGRKATVRKKAS